MTTSQAFISPFGPRSKERQAIEAKLKEGVEGDTLTRAAASMIMNMPCHPGDKGDRLVYRAIDGLRNEDGIYWEWSRTKQCWLCLSDPEKVESLNRRKKKATKIHVKTVHASKLVQPKNLNDDQRRDWQITQMQCIAAAFVASRQVQTAALASKVNPIELRLPDASKLIALMKNSTTQDQT